MFLKSFSFLILSKSNDVRDLYPAPSQENLLILPLAIMDAVMCPPKGTDHSSFCCSDSDQSASTPVSSPSHHLQGPRGPRAQGLWIPRGTTNENPRCFHTFCIYILAVNFYVLSCLFATTYKNTLLLRFLSWGYPAREFPLIKHAGVAEQEATFLIYNKRVQTRASTSLATEMSRKSERYNKETFSLELGVHVSIACEFQNETAS